ncbi:MAG: GTPase ObgE [Oscillospiraceae bacterium]|nr:GTPase ObgE [Oscillospiraceae bacterium]
MFVDKVEITIKAGNGGNGAVSFHREKYVNAGGPDGGDGGKGSDIVFVADDSLSTLIDFRYKKKYIAPDGEPGGAKRCSGKSMEPTVIRVPRGTIVKDSHTGRILADVSDDEPVIVARGGKGGKGNVHFATPTRQIPRFAKPGFPGEKFDVTLELKLLADVGLVGFPNVGKSTLISVVSAAKPKIANYHFTTLTPVLGVVKRGEKSFVMADIPGLIEGASEGVGLGHAFLRHVERCRLIVHVVDVSGIEGRDPAEDFDKINAELANFSEELAERPQIVAANKCDLASEEQIAAFEKFITDKGLRLFKISAATTEGTDALIDAVTAELDKLPPVKRYEAVPLTLEEIARLDEQKHSFAVEKAEDGVYIVDAEWLAPILSTVNMDDYESLQYFQRVLRSSGIIDELERQGIQEDDVVAIYDFEFNYVR